MLDPSGGSASGALFNSSFCDSSCFPPRLGYRRHHHSSVNVHPPTSAPHAFVVPPRSAFRIPRMMSNRSLTICLCSIGTVNPGEDVFTGLAGEGSPASASKKDSPSAAQTAAQAASAAAAAQAAADEEAKEGGPVKANKGMILRKSVEYIRYLQQLVNAQAARNRDLEAQLVRAGVSTAGGSGGSPAGVTSSPSSNGNGNGMGGGGGVNGKGDEGDVLNLHSFGPEDGESPGSAGEYLGMNLGMGGMSMGGVGFGGLEPMAESHEMEMDEDYGHHHHHPGHSQPHPGHYHPQQHHQQQQQHHAHHQQHGVNGHTNTNGMNGLGRMRPQRDGSGDLESVGEKEETSPSAGSLGAGLVLGRA
ncbi:hypothetical protein BD410DRAFT_313378 [Rickenella mellea]|uniref:Uncharacterized protein n=1 Tax=Rickenella mellea TaxID=50990 RepID=A0A4Y7PH89_9AGAM|nr:hypothetical protein BD410DRAFT_313378 [Rickenella mellea]